MMCHPRLPLIAALDSERPAVRVWDVGGQRLREVWRAGAESDVYGDEHGWAKFQRIPVVAWHPDQPWLVVKNEDGVLLWTPSGLSELDGLPPGASYHNLAFSPDGSTLWAAPGDEINSWEYSSHAIDVASGAVHAGRHWDTGVAVHPAGGLVATLSSDQGATHMLFARPSQVMRVLNRALILDADGYRTPVFSSDGRYFAIRGSAYEHTLEVFEFPTLRRVLGTVLGEPYPSDEVSDEWWEQHEAWSAHNIAFGTRPGVLWIGTPAGTLIELDVGTQEAVGHDLLAGAGITALSATATGELIVAGGAGELVLVAGFPAAEPAAGSTVAEFLADASDIPDGGNLDEHLILTDGTRTWQPGDLDTASAAADTDPTWLRLKVAINTLGE
ncbi:hypothetical protein AOZ06_22990 [Kibdelosporangium phytohabitans]|uniref:WD40 repeat domain-containing protein n=1 Tax=Kibdelosporangium phytohabitans TaxID=860235 RepID=A0A0N9IHX5_9PSEU|nr:hypothetical protein AOZ06_22990 [Kibdelosporangium phytohabitans]